LMLSTAESDGFASSAAEGGLAVADSTRDEWVRVGHVPGDLVRMSGGGERERRKRRRREGAACPRRLQVDETRVRRAKRVESVANEANEGQKRAQNEASKRKETMKTKKADE
jgi:hypothetical protein